MKQYKHTIVIGGTGMLCEASVELARRSESLTSIARTHATLGVLDGLVANLACHHRRIALDYNQISDLQESIRAASREAGPGELIVAWIHDEEGPVPSAICEVASEAPHPVRFVHVMGSSAADPARSLDTLSTKLSVYPSMTCQQVILGFHAESGGSRWLTNSEISAGVIEATEVETSPYVVGEIRPWTSRP